MNAVLRATTGSPGSLRSRRVLIVRPQGSARSRRAECRHRTAGSDPGDSSPEPCGSTASLDGLRGKRHRRYQSTTHAEATPPTSNRLLRPFEWQPSTTSGRVTARCVRPWKRGSYDASLLNLASCRRVVPRGSARSANTSAWYNGQWLHSMVLYVSPGPRMAAHDRLDRVHKLRARPVVATLISSVNSNCSILAVLDQSSE